MDEALTYNVNTNTVRLNYEKFMFIVRDLDAHEKRQDRLRLLFFVLGSLGTALIVLGFVWTFFSYTLSQRLSLTGGVAAIVGGFGGVIVNIIRTRRTNTYIRGALSELDTCDLLKDHFMPVVRIFSEMSMGQGTRFPFQIPMLTIIPGMAMFNSLHNFNHTDGCPRPNDRFSGLTESEKSMVILDLIVGLMGLCVNMSGVLYYTLKLVRHRGDWVARKIEEIANILIK